MANINIKSPITEALQGLQGMAMDVWQQNQRYKQSEETKKLSFGASSLETATKGLDVDSTDEDFKVALDHVADWKGNKYLGATAGLLEEKVESLQGIAKEKVKTVDDFNVRLDTARKAAGEWRTTDDANGLSEMLKNLREIRFHDLTYLAQGEKNDMEQSLNTISSELMTKTFMTNLFADEMKQIEANKGKKPKGMDSRIFNSVVEATAAIDAGLWSSAVQELQGFDELKERIYNDEQAKLTETTGVDSNIMKELNNVNQNILLPASGEKNPEDYVGDREGWASLNAIKNTRITTDTSDRIITETDEQYQNAINSILNTAEGIHDKEAPAWISRKDGIWKNNIALTNYLLGRNTDGSIPEEFSKYSGDMLADKLNEISEKRISKIDWKGVGKMGQNDPIVGNLKQLLKGRQLLRGSRPELFIKKGIGSIDPNKLTEVVKEKDGLVGKTVKSGKSAISNVIDYYPGLRPSVDALKGMMPTEQEKDIIEQNMAGQWDLTKQQNLNFVNWIKDLTKSTPPY